DQRRVLQAPSRRGAEPGPSGLASSAGAAIPPRPELARDGADGAIDRSKARDNPRDPAAPDAASMFGTRVAEPISASGPHRLRQQAGHMTASDQTARLCHSCKQGAVHIWIPAFAGMTQGCVAVLRVLRETSASSALKRSFSLPSEELLHPSRVI